MRLAFIIDPIEKLLPHHDTTFVLMLEGLARGHEVYCLRVESLFIRDCTGHGVAWRVEVMRPDTPAAPHYRLLHKHVEPLTFFDAVFMRKDPPFDVSYLNATHVLSLVDPEQTLVVNDPRGLRDANEKLYALHFPEVIPPTLVSAEPARLKEFMEEMGGEMIVKPLDGFGGLGIFHVHRADRNLNAILETVTLHGHRMVMGQQYLPDVRVGDKRIIVLDGKPLGALLRVPRADETRSNMAVGGTGTKTELTPRDREICARLAPRLSRDGLYFVGLDVIGGFLTEVNVTSPTGVQEINAHDGTKLEADVLDFVEQRVHALPGRKH